MTSLNDRFGTSRRFAAMPKFDRWGTTTWRPRHGVRDPTLIKACRRVDPRRDGLRCGSLFLAHRVNSRQRSTSIRFRSEADIDRAALASRRVKTASSASAFILASDAIAASFVRFSRPDARSCHARTHAVTAPRPESRGFPVCSDIVGFFCKRRFKQACGLQLLEHLREFGSVTLVRKARFLVVELLAAALATSQCIGGGSTAGSSHASKASTPKLASSSPTNSIPSSSPRSVI